MDRITLVEKQRRVNSFLGLSKTKRGSIEDFRKVIQLIFDETLMVLSTSKFVKSSYCAIVFGSMSIAPILLRLLNRKILIIYDPFANYAQTLYLRIPYEAPVKRVMLKLRLMVFLLLQHFSLRASDIVVYPCEWDSKNAEKMFKLCP